MKMEVDVTRLYKLVTMVSENDDACYQCPLRGTNILCPYNGGENTQWPCDTALWRWLKGAQN